MERIKEKSFEEEQKHQIEILNELGKFGKKYIRPKYGLDLENSFHIIVGEFLKSHNII